MKRIIGAKWLWLTVIIISVIAMMPVSTVVAGEQKAQADEQQIELLKELWGKDMTLGEVLEKVFPEALEDRTKEELEVLHSFKMIWPDPLAEYPESTTPAPPEKTLLQRPLQRMHLT